MREFLHYYSVVGIEEDEVIQLYLYNAKTDALIPFEITEPNPDPDPDPDPDPEPFVFDLRVALIDPNTGVLSWVDMAERFEIYEAQTDGDDMVFHIKTEKDKMSMQGGVLFIVPYNMTIDPQTAMSASVSVSFPRQPEWEPMPGSIKWERNEASGFWGLTVNVNGTEMYGLDNSSADHPKNWYYGFEIQGRIPLA